MTKKCSTKSKRTTTADGENVKYVLKCPICRNAQEVKWTDMKLRNMCFVAACKNCDNRTFKYTIDDIVSDSMMTSEW